MIAELYGKISGTGSNLTDRLEDDLTGNVFGTLRYLPFHEGVGRILATARIAELSTLLRKNRLSYWADRISFWPYHKEGELDVLIELDDSVIGIEVKYCSGLSSDDEVDNSETGKEFEYSSNQLARESRIVKEKSGKKKSFLIFIANDSACASTYRNVISRHILEVGVQLGYVSWQEILIQLERHIIDDPFGRLILADVIALLKKKGFERFQSFEISSNASICADDYYCYEYFPNRSFNFQLIDQVDGGAYYEYR